MSSLGNTLEFFGRLGVYDVLLPFLLIYTLTFAILEKTAVLGFEHRKDGKGTKKNQNSMIAFVSAFLVVASSNLVRIISEIIANTMILIVLMVFFLMLLGTFHTQQEKDFGFDIFSDSDGKKNGLYWGFAAVMTLGIMIIFLNALGWLMPAYYFLMNGANSMMLQSIIALAFFVGLALFITRDGKEA